LWIFRTSVEKIQVPLKSDKNHRHVPRRPVHIYSNNSLSSYNEKCFEQKLWRKSKHNFMFNNFFPKIVAFKETTWPNAVLIQATCDNTIRVQCRKSCNKVDTLISFNIYCFSMATTVTRTRFNVTLHVHCLLTPPPPSCLISSTIVLFTLNYSPAGVTDFFPFTLPFKRVYGPIKPLRFFRCSSNLSHRSAPFILYVTLYTEIYLVLK
jgi:hypothetical protein